MKNSLFCCILIFLVLSSFIFKSDFRNLNGNETLTTLETSDTLPCFSSDKIYSETAFLWQASWVAYFNKYRGGNYVDSPQLHFDENNLNLLQSKILNEQFPGVILWYVMLEEDDPYPSLAMQNTISCTIDVEGGTIIMSPWNSGRVRQISQDSLDIYKRNWKRTTLKNRAVHTPVFAYNYSWNSIRAQMDNNSASSGVFFSYGLRTIEPNESDYLTSPFSDKTGNVVYCNVMYNSENESNPLSNLENFAMPCPTFCGDN